MPDKKQDRKGVLATEISSQVDASYRLSDRMTLTDACKGARLSSMEYQDDEVNGLTTDNDEREDETLEEVVWDFHYLQDFSN